MTYPSSEAKGQGLSQIALALLWEGKEGKEPLNVVRGLKRESTYLQRKRHTMRPWLLIPSLSHEEKWRQNTAWCKDVKTALGQICKWLWENIPSEALRSTDMFSHKSLGKTGSYFPSKRHSRRQGELRATPLPCTTTHFCLYPADHTAIALLYNYVKIENTIRV